MVRVTTPLQPWRVLSAILTITVTGIVVVGGQNAPPYAVAAVAALLLTAFTIVQLLASRPLGHSLDP